MAETDTENNSEIAIITTNEAPTDIQKVEEIDSPICNYANKLDEEFKPRTNCKFCMSPHRVEAEAEWEKTKSLKMTYAFLKARGYDGLYHSMRNHIISHYRRYETQTRIKEWAKNLPVLMKQQKSREKSLKDRVAALTYEFYVMASKAEEEETENRTKITEAMRKLSDSITLLEDKYVEEQKRNQPILIIVERLKDIISSRIKKTDNNAVKCELMKVLELWIDSVKDLEVEI